MAVFIWPPMKTAKAREAARKHCRGRACCAVVGEGKTCTAPADRTLIMMMGAGTSPGVLEIFVCKRHRFRFRKANAGATQDTDR